MTHGVENHFLYQGEKYPAKLLCDISHPEGAEIRSVYQEDFYAGSPVLTENSFGKGKAWYVATRSNEAFYRRFAEELCARCNQEPLAEPREDLEVTQRCNENGSFLFFLNHGTETRTIIVKESGTELLTGNEKKAGEEITLPPKDVAIFYSRRKEIC